MTVAVTTGQGTATATQKFTYLSRPEVRELGPPTGPKGGGTTVTLTGINFRGVKSVKFGAKLATAVQVLSSTKLTAKAPAGSGTVTVAITANGGTSEATSTNRSPTPPGRESLRCPLQADQAPIRLG